MTRMEQALEFQLNSALYTEEKIHQEILSVKREAEALAEKLDLSNPRSELYQQRLRAQREVDAFCGIIKALTRSLRTR